MTLEQTLKTFIEETLLHDDSNPSVDCDEPLIERGVLDSMGLMNLIGFLEERAGVRVPDEEVLLENFATINTIIATADRLRNAR